MHSPITSIEEPFISTKVPFTSAFNPNKRSSNATKEAVISLGMICSPAILKYKKLSVKQKIRNNETVFNVSFRFERKSLTLFIFFYNHRLHIVGSAHVPANPERVYFTRNLFFKRKGLPKELDSRNPVIIYSPIGIYEFIASDCSSCYFFTACMDYLWIRACYDFIVVCFVGF